MPTNRRKKSRGQRISRELEGLFLVGCGWNEIERSKGLPWIRQQWNQYGRAFMKANADHPCWALEFLGLPEEALLP